MRKLTWLWITFSLLVLIVLIFTFIPEAKESNEDHSGYITLWFDDGLLSTYEVAYPILEEKNWKGVLAVIADQKIANKKFIPDGDPIMSWEQVEELRDAGWEISSHSMTHPRFNNITDEMTLRLEIVSSKDRLEEMGFRIDSFTLPYGEKGDKFAEKLVLEEYSYWRSCIHETNPIPPERHIRSYLLTTEHQKDDIISWIQKAEKNEEWLVICFHAIVDTPSHRWQHTYSQFLMVIEEIERSNLKVVLPSEIFDQYSCKEVQ